MYKSALIGMAVGALVGAWIVESYRPAYDFVGKCSDTAMSTGKKVLSKLEKAQKATQE